MNSGLLPVLVAAEVDDDDRGQDQDGVLAVADVDAVGVGPGEELLGDRRQRTAGAGKDVFLVVEVALGVQVVGTGDVDGEPAAEAGERPLLDDRGLAIALPDLVGRSPREELLPDEGELVAGEVLERQLVAEAELFSVLIDRPE